MSDKPKRPRDINQLAKSIVDQATGSDDEQPDTSKLSAARAKAGRKGAKARLKSLTERERAEIAHLAATARWKKKD